MYIKNCGCDSNVGVGLVADEEVVGDKLVVECNREVQVVEWLLTMGSNTCAVETDDRERTLYT